MITEASNKDYPVLVKIWESAVLATHDFLSEEDFLFYKSQLPFYFEHVSLYVFKDESLTIKGFLGVSEDNIEMLFIENESRGMGIGKKLLNFAIDSLNLRKVDVNEQNTQALRFYEQRGFIKTGYADCDSEGKNYPVISLELS
ncbi:GNAT family N-acetyltransferase [Dysgonomonas sp. GY617]|uniref:GNAT family N-acetyltransferase n=1 Tax=Dysgonomonas sp. GY617 TaxID=2780420 RepID=UPI0018843B33|nr:GNAT family N-acetyltransferase [Dysgonomonas sp. GY617]MBF0576574.1 GNAT family N-acetyltransferase [Dysgonomonas sp. GY617]